MTKDTIKDTTEYKFLEENAKGYEIEFHDEYVQFTKRIIQPYRENRDKGGNLIVYLFYEDADITLRKVTGNNTLLGTTFQTYIESGWLEDVSILKLLKDEFDIPRTPKPLHDPQTCHSCIWRSNQPYPPPCKPAKSSTKTTNSANPAINDD